MVSGGGSSSGSAGKKRKAAAGGRADLPERHEPRRGLGVAALESLIAARFETAKALYMFPPPPPPHLIGYVTGAQFNPYVGNEGLQRDYYQQHYAAQQQQYYTSDVFARVVQATSGHVVPRQSNQQVDQSAGVVMAAAAPPPLPEHDHHRQAQAEHQHQHHRLLEHNHHLQAQAQHHHGQMRRPQAAVDVIDLVDDDDDDAGAGEELDLELRL